MDLVHRTSRGPDTQRPVFLICVFRNEGALLEYFIKYYEELGITHFIMIDNLSDDGGPDFLKSLTSTNLSLYRTDQSYRDADYGVRWINDVLQEQCQNQYCLVVDADELFIFDSRKHTSLSMLVDEMEAADANVLATNLLDMYPRRLGEPYVPGADFRIHSPYFDRWNTVYYSEHHRIYDRSFHKVGGMRQRIFDARVCIHNFPFFKYDFSPLGLAPGRHYFEHEGKKLRSTGKIRLHEHPGILLHFKYLRPDFRQFVIDRIKNNQDWNESAEYRNYLRLLDADAPLYFFNPTYSKMMTCIDDLDPFFELSMRPDVSA